jgi:hypothetical protein
MSAFGGKADMPFCDPLWASPSVTGARSGAIGHPIKRPKKFVTKQREKIGKVGEWVTLFAHYSRSRIATSHRVLLVLWGPLQPRALKSSGAARGRIAKMRSLLNR